jgi:hypothetical protein
MQQTKMQRDYSRYKSEGRIGHIGEPSWSKEKKLHTCCLSKTRWLHRVKCPRATGDGKLPPDA